MKKLLIVSPYFPPVNAPDMQRVRTLLPYLASSGWQATVLTVVPASVDGAVIDEGLLETLPLNVAVERVAGLAGKWSGWLGRGNLWRRCGKAVKAHGDRLLRSGNFDLVFISTTQFPFFRLGPLWRAEFGVPYVVDYQGSWVTDYYRKNRVRPPGGSFRFTLCQWEARRREPAILRGASGIIAVSPIYGSQLQRSYPWFDPSRIVLLPFGANPADLAGLDQGYRPKHSLVPFGDGNYHHVYAGRCGPDIRIALIALFRAFKCYLSVFPAEASKIRFHFIGTDHAPPPVGRPWIFPIAQAEGVADFVNEHCGPVPYFDTLYHLKQADALIGIGSDDPVYSASKFFPYLLAQRPTLFIFHEHSQVSAFAKQMGLNYLFTFRSTPQIPELAKEIAVRWFLAGGRHLAPAWRMMHFVPYTAAELAPRLAAVFDAAVAARRCARAGDNIAAEFPADSLEVKARP